MRRKIKKEIDENDMNLMELLNTKLDKVYFYSIMGILIAGMTYMHMANQKLGQKIDILLTVNPAARKLIKELAANDMPIDKIPDKRLPDITPKCVAIIKEEKKDEVRRTD